MASLKTLLEFGQSMWLDYMRRSLMTSGELEGLVQSGLRGVTSNPDIFKKAITGSDDYDDALRTLLQSEPGIDEKSLYENLAVEDIRLAADVLRPVYDASGGDDGFVSLEVSPLLARDADGTVDEARRLWDSIDRPNAMIKVPATIECLSAIEALIAEGININVTLMFSLRHYEAVVQAYLRGLQRCAHPAKVASVASFFISRVNGKVDPLLEEIGTPEARALLGKIATSNAKLAYRRFREIFHGEPFASLQAKGARVQRCLWASTSTKNPAYSDVLYVEELIGPDTVNTAPPSTIDAFRDHGRVEATLEKGVEEAEQDLQRLAGLGIDLDSITSQLQEDGVDAFAKSFEELLEAMRQVKESFSAERQPKTLSLGDYEEPVRDRLRSWEKSNFACRMWRKDPTLWFREPVAEIADRLGWLTLPEAMEEEIERLEGFAAGVQDVGVRWVVLLGMGGSSLAPEVFQQVFGNAEGFPELLVLDSTHPDAVSAMERRISLKDTLFLVSSKSGTTTETLSFFYYFWNRMKGEIGGAASRFVAITDPGSALEKLAEERNFRRIFNAPPDVGGRYAALSHFGLVPAALIGLDLRGLLDRARSMGEASAFCVSSRKSPGLHLGAALGELAAAGRDKLTLAMSPALEPFSAWLEQLVAESTGKDGKGIVPIAGESLGPPSLYDSDRLFVATLLRGDDTERIEGRLSALEAAGHPVVRILLEEEIDLGREIFRWELAVPAAAAVLGVHPFDQPDVELAKKLARQAMQAGDEPSGQGSAETVGIDAPELESALRSWIESRKEGDYLAVQAYLAPSRENVAALDSLREALRERIRAASTLGFGPRFLHSTGQLHKGGADNGLFLQLVDEPSTDLPVPETEYTFGELIRAQALGDFQALQQRGRRALRIQLGRDSAESLRRLIDSTE